ncbi:MAG: ArnT family glycosyltransferase [Candidatus Levyibacteriota bacterium]
MKKGILQFAEKYMTLFFIFFLALGLRFFHLATIPNGFHIDELVSGYVGRFILLHGKDIYGNPFPLFYFDSFGDYRVIFPFYIEGLSTFLFGVNEFAIRFPAAFFGSLLVFPVFSFAKLFFKKNSYAIIPAFFVAILPWHIVLSRASSEGVIGLTVFTTAVVFLLFALQQNNKKLLFFSCVLFASTYFMYPTFRVLTVLAVLPILFLAKKKMKRVSFLVIVFFILLTGIMSQTVWGKGRLLQTSLFTNKDIAASITGTNQAYSFDEGQKNIFEARLFHNKIVGYVQIFTQQYLNYFSTDFLFVKGGLPYRYTVPSVGLLFVTMGIFLVAILLPDDIANVPIFYYVFYLLFVAPLVSAITVDDTPNIHRALFMIVPFVLLASLGAVKLFLITRKFHRFFAYGVVALLSLSLLIEFSYFWHQYTNHTASFKSYLRDDGQKEIVEYVAANLSHAKQIIMTTGDALPLYYLFYTNNFDPSFAGKFTKPIFIPRINNITFIKDSCPENVINNKALLPGAIIIENGDCDQKAPYQDVKIFYRKDSTKAFKILIPSGD